MKTTEYNANAQIQTASTSAKEVGYNGQVEDPTGAEQSPSSSTTE